MDEQTLHPFRNVFSGRTGHKYISLLTGKEGDVSMLGIVGTASHPTDLLSQSLQGVRLGSQIRSKVKRRSKQCRVLKPNNGLNHSFDRKCCLPVGGGKGQKEENES